MNSRINQKQSFYAIVSKEVERFLEKENIHIPEHSSTRMVDLFFQTIGIKQYTEKSQINIDIRDYIQIPIITAKEYAKAHNMPVEQLIIKAIDNMQTRIKEYIQNHPFK